MSVRLPAAALVLAATLALARAVATADPPSGEPAGRPEARPGARPVVGGAGPADRRETVISLAAVGDMMFGRYYPDKTYHAFGLEDPFRGVKPLFAGRDIVFGNLETPISATLYSRPYRGLTFRADPRSAAILRDGGFTLAVTANNHAFDQGDRGVRDTLGHLAAAGLGVTGTGRTEAEAFTPYVYVKRGVKVAVLGVTILRNFPPKQRLGFHAYIAAKDVHRELPARIKAIRSQYDFFVVSLHFGVEYYQTVSRFDRTLMDQLQAVGVDVVIGHHPHVLRPVDHRGKMVIFYSMGNFLFDYEMKNTGNAGVAQLELAKRGATRAIRNVRFVPVYRHWRKIPMPASGVRARRIRDELTRISARLKTGTRFVLAGEALEILPPP